MNIGFKAKWNSSLVVTMLSTNELIVVTIVVKTGLNLIYLFMKLGDVTCGIIASFQILGLVGSLAYK